MKTLLLLIIITLLVSSCSKSEKFTFAVIGDSRPDHFCESKKQFIRQIDEINKINPIFTINVGDLIKGYTSNDSIISKMWDNYNNDISKFKSPYFQVAGNHDIWDQNSKDIYTKKFGNTWYSISHLNSHFIILNSEDLPNHFQDIAGKQMLWLKKELKENENKENIFIFAHKPLWLYTNNWNTEVHPVLAKAKNVKAVFVGHNHQYVKFPDKDGIKYIITGGGGASLNGTKFTGGFYHWLSVSVDGGNININVIKENSIEKEDVVLYKNILLLKEWTSSSIKFKTFIIKEKQKDNSFKPNFFNVITQKSTNKVEIYIRNILDKEQEFTLDWTKKNTDWSIKPLTQSLKLKANKDTTIFVEISLKTKNKSFKKSPFLIIKGNIEDNDVYSKIRIPMSKKIITIKKSSKLPAIDGVINKNEWNNKIKEKLTYFEKTITQKTEAYAMYNDSAFYFAIKCYDKNMDILTIDSASIFNGDEFELFLSSDMINFVKFGANANGNSYVSKKDRYSQKVKSAPNYAIKKYNNRWECEVVIPFSNFKTKPSSNPIWKFNYGRIRVLNSGLNEFGTWCGDFNEIKKFGFIKFE